MAYKLRKDPINEIPKAQLVFWIIVRVSMLICAGYSFIHGDVVMGFESVFCFIFAHLWDMFQVFGHTSFIIEVPPLSQTMLNLIIFIGIVFNRIRRVRRSSHGGKHAAFAVQRRLDGNHSEILRFGNIGK